MLLPRAQMTSINLYKERSVQLIVVERWPSLVASRKLEGSLTMVGDPIEQSVVGSQLQLSHGGIVGRR